MGSDENTVNLATADLFHAEIARLHGVNDRLRAEIERLRAKVFNPVTLTDAEREAVAKSERRARLEGYDSDAATLRWLLERTRPQS